MRAGKLPLDAISGTVGFLDSASKVVKGLSAAASAVVEEASKTAQTLTAPPAPKDNPPAVPPERGGPG